MNTPLPPAAGLAKSLILAVDDISKNLQVVGTLLRREGYRIVPATTALRRSSVCAPRRRT